MERKELRKELLKELRKEMIQKIAFSLLNNQKYNNDKIYCKQHVVKKANFIEKIFYKYYKETYMNTYIDTSVIDYIITNTVINKTKICKIK
jgi:hypothetical protein